MRFLSILFFFCSLTALLGQDRPQTPVPPFPYQSDSIFFENESAALRLAGTLTRPEGTGPFPALILITGSGAQDRDETMFGHRPFAIIADYLTRRGYAVLRYDDRGFGQSEGTFQGATSADFTSDAAAALDYLAAQSFVDTTRLGALGHSEGGMLVPTLEEIDFAILLAAPAVPIPELMALQNELVLRSTGIDSLMAADYAYEIILPYFREVSSGKLKGYSDALKYLRDKVARMNPTTQKTLGLNEQLMKGLALQSFSPWFKYFISFDVRPYLRELAVPVLALNGGKDVQVDAQQNLSSLRGLLVNGAAPSFLIKRMPNLNHLFQEAETGAVKEYEEIEQSFSPDALQIIGTWLDKTLD